MTFPSPTASPTGLGIAYEGNSSPNPGQNWYRRRDPTTRDFQNYQVLDRWINLATGTIWMLASKSAAAATWSAIGGTGSGLSTLTGDSGGAISPVANNITLAGTANQITTTGTAGTITFSVPAVFIAPGSIASTTTLASGTSLAVGTTAVVGTGLTVSAGGAAITGNSTVTGSLTASTTLTATLGAITATNGNVVLGSAGNKLLIHATTAASDSVGTSAAMTAGAITVSTTAVTAASKIFLTANTPGGTQGTLSAPTASIVPGVSFDINSSNAADTSTVNYWIVN